MQALRERVDHVENTMGKYSMSFNILVDAHGAHNDEILWLKDKIVDLEDSCRRNNLKIRGSPKMVFESQLLKYVHDLLTSLAPRFSALELTVDRVHRVPKPSFLAAKVSRNVLLRLNF